MLQVTPVDYDFPEHFIDLRVTRDKALAAACDQYRADIERTDIGRQHYYDKKSSAKWLSDMKGKIDSLLSIAIHKPSPAVLSFHNKARQAFANMTQIIMGSDNYNSDHIHRVRDQASLVCDLIYKLSVEAQGYQRGSAQVRAGSFKAALQIIGVVMPKFGSVGETYRQCFLTFRDGKLCVYGTDGSSFRWAEIEGAEVSVPFSTMITFDTLWGSHEYPGLFNLIDEQTILHLEYDMHDAVLIIQYDERSSAKRLNNFQRGLVGSVHLKMSSACSWLPVFTQADSADNSFLFRLTAKQVKSFKEALTHVAKFIETGRGAREILSAVQIVIDDGLVTLQASNGYAASSCRCEAETGMARKLNIPADDLRKSFRSVQGEVTLSAGASFITITNGEVETQIKLIDGSFTWPEEEYLMTTSFDPTIFETALDTLKGFTSSRDNQNRDDALEMVIRTQSVLGYGQHDAWTLITPSVDTHSSFNEFIVWGEVDADRLSLVNGRVIVHYKRSVWNELLQTLSMAKKHGHIQMSLAVQDKRERFDMTMIRIDYGPFSDLFMAPLVFSDNGYKRSDTYARAMKLWKQHRESIEQIRDFPEELLTHSWNNLPYEVRERYEWGDEHADAVRKADQTIHDIKDFIGRDDVWALWELFGNDRPQWIAKDAQIPDFPGVLPALDGYREEGMADEFAWLDEYTPHQALELGLWPFYIYRQNHRRHYEDRRHQERTIRLPTHYNRKVVSLLLDKIPAIETLGVDKKEVRVLIPDAWEKIVEPGMYLSKFGDEIWISSGDVLLVDDHDRPVMMVTGQGYKEKPQIVTVYPHTLSEQA